MINDILFQASNFWLAVHLSEWCTKSDLVLLGHCKITSHQYVIKISMNSNFGIMVFYTKKSPQNSWFLAFRDTLLESKITKYWDPLYVEKRYFLNVTCSSVMSLWFQCLYRVFLIYINTLTLYVRNYLIILPTCDGLSLKLHVLHIKQFQVQNS